MSTRNIVETENLTSYQNGAITLITEISDRFYYWVFMKLTDLMENEHLEDLVLTKRELDNLGIGDREIIELERHNIAFRQSDKPLADDIDPVYSITNFYIHVSQLKGYDEVKLDFCLEDTL